MRGQIKRRILSREIKRNMADMRATQCLLPAVLVDLMQSCSLATGAQIR